MKDNFDILINIAAVRLQFKYTVPVYNTVVVQETLRSNRLDSPGQIIQLILLSDTRNTTYTSICKKIRCGTRTIVKIRYAHYNCQNKIIRTKTKVRYSYN